jgi:hypothetical protein
MEISKTPKRKENVAKFVDNKRTHLQRNLSAAQMDKMLLDEAKEDATSFPGSLLLSWVRG